MCLEDPWHGETEEDHPDTWSLPQQSSAFFLLHARVLFEEKVPGLEKICRPALRPLHLAESLSSSSWSSQ